MGKDSAMVWLAIAISLVLAGSCDTLQDPPRRALPSTATDVHEHNWDTYVRDYCYILKAKITPEEFEVYRKKLKLVPIPENKKEEVDWQAWDNFGDWWDPSATVEGTFYNPTMTGSQHAFTKHENGYVYYLEYAGF